jgi:uncharacterized protein (DUF1697 family)
MTTYVVLLRGVMPTGKNKVPMALLRQKLSEAGLREVRTYIQSGNVLVQTELTAAEVEILVHDVVKQSFGGELAVMARTTGQFQKILTQNPFTQADTSCLYFSLLSARPDSALLKDFEAIDFSPDQIRVIDDVIYTLYETKLSNSKFTNNWFERKLKVSATTRNFNTMQALVEMSQS